MALTAQQKTFVEEYLRCWNATEAARRAKYSEKTARQQGSRLLTNVDIEAAIKERLDELKLSADEVLVRLGEQARGTMAHFLKVTDSGSVRFDFSNGRDYLHLIKRFKTRKTDDGFEMELELYDAQNALQLLGKHHRLFADKVEVDWKKEFENAGLSPAEEFERMVNAYAQRLKSGVTAHDASRAG